MECERNHYQRKTYFVQLIKLENETLIIKTKQKEEQ